MHTLSNMGDGTYGVGYYAVFTDNGVQDWVPLFNKLSLATAMVVVSSLNGGRTLDSGKALDSDILKMLERCT